MNSYLAVEFHSCVCPNWYRTILQTISKHSWDGQVGWACFRPDPSYCVESVHWFLIGPVNCMNHSDAYDLSIFILIIWGRKSRTGSLVVGSCAVFWEMNIVIIFFGIKGVFFLTDWQFKVKAIKAAALKKDFFFFILSIYLIVTIFPLPMYMLVLLYGVYE